MSWLKKIFAKPDWRMVKQVDAHYTLTIQKTINKITGQVVREEDKRNCTLSYYLYESENGKRIFDIVDSEEGDIDINRVDKSHFAFRNEIYRNKIKPWLDGRFDPEIPSYEQVPKDDFRNALAGKKVK